ncbi:MAG TPA: rhombotarget lipoprotein [Usitatibacteraceae bacterium]
MDPALSANTVPSTGRSSRVARRISLPRILGFSALFGALLLGGCALFGPSVKNRQAASVVDYLYPVAQPPEQATPAITRLRLPLRVGVAFAPSANAGMRQISQGERSEMLTRVKTAFADRPFIAQIEVIPEAYLQPRGGFENLDQVARLFQLDVICLLSYDQIQYMDDNPLSMLYWTVVGAYVIPATKYSTHTMLDAAVFDVGSRRLLFRAPGVSHINANRAPAVASEYARESLGKGFNQALDQLIPALQTELDGFRERVKNDAMVKVEPQPSYRGGGAPDLPGVLLLLMIAGLYAHAVRPR